MRHAAQIWTELVALTKTLAGAHEHFEFTAIIDTWGRVSIAVKSRSGHPPSKGGLKEMKSKVMAALQGNNDPKDSPFYPWLGPNPVLDLNADSLMAEVVTHGQVPLEGGPHNAYLLSRTISNESWKQPMGKNPEGWPPVVAFYSFKGGAGRSTAAALTALLMAREGKRLLLVDLDLEAPGLEGFFGMKVPEDGAGMVDLLLELSVIGDAWRGEVSEYRLRYAEDAAITSAGGRLDIAPAGRLDESYPERLGRLTLADMARPVGGVGEPASLNTIRRALEVLIADQDYDAVVVDCRTGFTDIGGMALNGLSSLDVLVFKASASEHPFVDVVIGHMERLRRESPSTGGDVDALARSLLVVFSLAQPPAAELERDQYEDELRALVSGVLWDRVFRHFGPELWSQPELRAIDTPFDPVPHDVVIIPYLRDFPALSRASDMTRAQEALSDPPYSRLMRRILDVKLAAPRTSEALQAPADTQSPDQDGLLEALAGVSPEVAAENELSSVQALTEKFLPRLAHRDLLNPEVLIIQGPKGTGKSALWCVFQHKQYLQQLARYVGASERERARLERTELVVAFPLGDPNDTKRAVQNLFSSMKSSPDQNPHEVLRGFWRGMLCWALQQGYTGLPASPERIKDAYDCVALALDEGRQRALIAWFRLASDHLKVARPKELQALYDSLDNRLTSDVYQRADLLSALVDLWRDLGGADSPFKGRIFLREDLWEREVKLTDKAKLQLGTHRIQLEWRPVELYRLVIKRLLKFNSFRYFLKNAGLWRSELDGPPPEAPLMGLVPPADEAWVRRVIEALVGETMGGGKKKGFVYTWLIAHTADANEKTRPRSLLMLFTQAARRQGQVPKDGPPLSSYSLREALRGEVSKSAVDELRAEYEFEWRSSADEWIPDLFVNIQGTWPIERERLQMGLASKLEWSEAKVDELLKQMESAGLLEPREQKSERLYQIPDIYLYGLGLTRKG